MSQAWTRRRFVQAASLLGASATSALYAADPPPLAPPEREPPDLAIPTPVSRQIRWAIVGLGKLALEEVMPAFAHCRWSRPTALVSGHPDKAKRVAAAYNINPKNIYNYESYDRMATNDNIDAVYIILPNNMHAEYTIRALNAGKHVLCEKPMAVTVEEGERMNAAAKETQRKLMIAYRLHYEPLNLKVVEMCAQKSLGPIRTISSSNCQDVQAPNIRLSRKLGGGPVEDVGIYSINACRYITNEEPIEVSAFAHQPADDPRFREVPASVAFTLRYPSGVLAHCDCSFASGESRYYRIHCGEGVIEMNPSFSYRGLRLFTHQAGKQNELRLREVDHFASEMDHFSECIVRDRPPRSTGAEGVADLRIIAALAESARSHKPVQLKG